MGVWKVVMIGPASSVIGFARAGVTGEWECGRVEVIGPAQFGDWACEGRWLE